MFSPEEFAHLKFPLKEIAEATNNFAQDNLIGQGGFGEIYRGNLLVAGEPTNIVVRRLHYDYGQGDLEFWNEISMLASLKHENLVSFIGFCNEKDKKIIINKHEVNGSLEKYLSSPKLSWMQRLQICVDIANALNYIHCGDGHRSSVIHRNIKSSKILLDENWKAKLSGFEHSKRNTRARRSRILLADIVGTIGYVDPTYEKTGFVTHKSDVYSFGVVLFEVLCGSRAYVFDEREPHSPQYFTGQDHKGGKLDVVQKLDDEIANNINKELALRKEKGKQTTKSTVLNEMELEMYGRIIADRPVSLQRPISQQDNKDGKLDVMEKLDDEMAINILRDMAVKKKKGEEEMKERRTRRMKKDKEFALQLKRELKMRRQKPAVVVDEQPSSFVDGQPSSFVDGQPSSFAGSLQSLFDEGRPPSFADSQPSSFSHNHSSAFEDNLSFSFDEGQPSSFRNLLLLLLDEGQPLISDSRPSLFDEGQTSLFGGARPNSESYSDIHVQPFSAIKPLPPCDFKYTMEKHFRLQPLYTMKRLDQYLHSPNEELLAELAKSHYDDENLCAMIDPDLWKQMDPKSFKIFSKTAYNCLKEKRVERPNIDQILSDLKNALKHQMIHENPEDSVVADETEETTPNHKKGVYLEHLKIPLIDIEMATRNFTDIPIGSGGYGNVYRAELEVPIVNKSKGRFSRQRRTVAIKCIREDKQGKEGFNTEIDLLTSCKHTNIVSLLGFCDEGSNLILVYEYVSNGSLDGYLETTITSTNLTWVQRIKIGIDIAQGLNYIHTMVEDEQRIVHRDIKSGNILLGKNWVAKIADFGLSRFHGADLKEKTVLTSNIAGTEYYLCPEYAENGRLKTAVDIYSLGVVLFELLAGKLAYDKIYTKEDKNGIAYVARRHFKDGTIHEIVDPKIMEEVDELTSTLHKGPNHDSLQIYIDIAHRCLATTQDNRPRSKEILEELEKALSLQENNKDSLQMSFEEIKSATQNFSPENIIGGGGFGKVFTGEVKRGSVSTTIVAKRLDRSQGQGEHHFLMELEILFEYKHENIIGLEGYCNENDEKIIVYEYASNRSLDRYLNHVSLSWIKRLKICIGIARGLAFLHGGASSNEMVIHRDIKSANILLNGDWKAKISDFGLSVITPRNEEAVSKLVGTIGYVDPQYGITGFFTEKSDIYSLGVLLFEILNGKLLVPTTKDYDQERVSRILKQIHEEEKIGSIVFEDIKEQIDPQSLSTYREIVSKCLYLDRRKRPTIEEVLQQLEISLGFQEDYEIWAPKLPHDYEEILKLSTDSGNYSTKMKKDLYDKFSNGIILQDEKVWFSLGCNGERNKIISARTFSYKNYSPHDMQCIVPESRFQNVVKMLDISNLMIKIKTRTQFLSPNTVYGVRLVFKFCDFKNISRNPIYVDLKYKKGSKTLHAYFAQWRDDEWMMIELYRFLNQKEDVVFKFLLESLSPYYCREHDAIYVEGIEFRAIDKVGHDESGKTKEIHQIMKSNSNNGQELQLPVESEVNDTKHFMLSAKAVLYNFSDLKLYISKPSPESRFQEMLELMPQQILRINCKIKSQKLSPDTKYACYLVFKLSENRQASHYPVEIRNLLQKNEGVEIVYFRHPRLLNVHDFTQVPRQRKDEWMEVNIWKFNSSLERKNDCVPVNLKLISYKGTIPGLIICGLEFRPIIAEWSQKKLCADHVTAELCQHTVFNSSKAVDSTTNVAQSSGKMKAGRKRNSSITVEKQDNKKICISL